MPVPALVDDCPLYDLVAEAAGEPLYPAPVRTLDDGTGAGDTAVTLLALLASPNIASRLPLFQQYDCIVQSRTVRRPEQADAAVLALPESPRAIAVSIDGNGRRVACDPYTGTIEAVLECTANLACAGAEPLGPDELPELRQPREAAHRLAADGVDPRARRRLPRARRAGRRRQRLALQRERRRPDLPDAGRRHRRRAARRRARRPLGLRARRRRDRARRAVPPAGWRAPSSRSCAARRCPIGLPAIDIAARARRAGGDPRRGPRRRAAQRPRRRRGRPARRASPSAASPAGSARRSTSARSTDAGELERILFGESPGCGFVVSGPAEALRALGEHVDARRLGTVGGDVLRVSYAGGECATTLEELRAAHAALARLFA